MRFILSNSKLRFEHNGETFRPQDIYAITDIGEGTKATDDDKIGRFGVGFKSVFAYSEAPHIWSPTFSFKITELVLPSELSARPDLDGRTRFDFPFNNPKKAPHSAYKEIETGLNELAETTLLFLRHIESIKWHIEGCNSGDILRIEHSAHHIEMLKQIDGQTTTSSHFLKFDRPVTDLESQRVAIAFSLDFLPNVPKYSSDKSLSSQLKIVPARGQVAVFFPAAKETSGLRFHLHAPFVPELSRASIKETPANKPLFDQLASLAASSLRPIRDLGLLTTDFLGTLPNPQEQLGHRYIGIRDSIITLIRNEQSHWHPAYAKGHAPARQLVQAKASLKELLGAEDLEFLIDYDDEPPQWAATRALQGTNVERFMNGLAIKDWDIEAFVDCVVENATDGGRPGVRQEFTNWLAAKNLEWHQQMYALLFRESEAQAATKRLRRCKIVRLVDGGYSVGSKCHFPDDSARRFDGIQCIDAAIYTTGKNKAQQDNARKFLESVGVTNISERHLVEAILKSRYVGDSRPFDRLDHLAHVRRFMKLLGENSSSSALLAAYPILMGRDNKWHKPSQLYLDRPYIDTGLGEYLKFPDASATPLFALASLYMSMPIDTGEVVRFAKTLGCHVTITPVQQSCSNNPEWNYLRGVGGKSYTSWIDLDFAIPEFEALVASKSVRLARLVWNTVHSLSIAAPAYYAPHLHNPLRAVYRKNTSNGARSADSQLIHQLRSGAWVPQRGGEFVLPADARAELLPDGFTFDSGWSWIKTIQFGQNIQIQSERAQEAAADYAKQQRKQQDAAEALGFSDVDTARRLAEIPPDELVTMLSERERRRRVELPEHEPANPVRRASHVSFDAKTAPERRTEIRERSVSIARDGVKAETDQYLRQQYTNADVEQICQICKSILPFKLDNGAHFFEAVELMPELSRHHHQNYLCLCPNHSAMFRHANGSRDTLRDRMLQQVDNELAFVLAQQAMTIYFTKLHLADMKAVIHAEQDGNQPAAVSLHL